MHSNLPTRSLAARPFSWLRTLAASTALSTVAMTALSATPALAQSAPTSIAILSPAADDGVNSHGGMIVGKVIGNLANVTSLTAQVGSDATTLRTIEVNKTSGEFAYPVFSADIASGQPVTVTFKLTRSGQTESDPFTFVTGPGMGKDRTAIAFSRLSFGWSPLLNTQVSQAGFANWVKAQLDPARKVPESKLGHEPWLSYENSIQTSSWGGTPNSAGVAVMDQNGFYRNTILQRLFTAAYSDRQLNEKLAVFWANHFWDIPGDATTHYPVYRMHEIEKYRQYALSSFRNLLTVSSENPLMMDFLSNRQNTAKAHNENFGREVLELHTVGTHAGYSDDDVTAVSRVFTGWTMVQSNDPNVQMWHGSTVSGESDPSGVQNEYVFTFDPTLHDTGDKFIPFLNLTIKGQSGAGGINEGRQLLDALAIHPSTKQHICSELVQTLVADVPPADAVQRCIDAWGDTGVIAKVVGAILLDPSYLTTVESSTKVKTPFEFAVGLMRNFGMSPMWTGGQFTPTTMLYNVYNNIAAAGEDIGRFNLPVGFGDDATSWLGQSQLVARLNASNLTENTQYVTLDWSNFSGVSHTVPATSTTPATWVPDAATKEEAAAALLDNTTGDNYSRPEFDAVATAFASPKGFVYASDFNTRVKKAARVLLLLPAYELK